MNASNISGGTLNVNIGGTGVNTLAVGQLLVGNLTNPITQSGNLTWDNTNNILTSSNIAGNASRLTNLNVSNVTDGTLTVSRGGTGATNFTAGRLLLGNGTTNITENGNLSWDSALNTLTATNIIGSGTNITNLTATNLTGTINNDRITLTAAKIPDLDATKITSGTINNDRITLTAAKIPDLDAGKITSGTINNDRIT